MNRIFVAAASAAVSWFVYYELAVYFGSVSPMFIANALIVSLFVHELGHMIAMEWNGVKARILFLVVMGGTEPMKGYEGKMKRLPWNKRCAIAMAGSVGTALVVLGTFVLWLWGFVTTDVLERMTNMNGILLYFNLLPFWMLDGSRFARILFDSVPEHNDLDYVLGMGLLAFFGAVVMLFTFGQNFLFTTWFFMYGLNYRAKRDDPHGSRNHLAMTREQTRFWAVAYTALFVLGVLFAAGSPFWMK